MDSFFELFSAQVALIPLFPLLGAVIIALAAAIGRPMSRLTAGWTASIAVIMSALFSFETLLTVIVRDGTPVRYTVYRWMEIGGLSADIGFLADPLSAVMICVITGVGLLIHIYSVGYMDEEPDRGVWRYFCYLNLFVFAMLLLVLGDNFLLMFVGWEGVGLCSYLLIGYWYENVEFAKAGKKAFVTNRVGDFMFIVGLFWLFWTLGDQATINFEALREVVAANPAVVGGLGGTAITGICLLFFGGATGKSAQIPLYVWLPDAMAGPTPVSALIHAATMVTSGIYMICRLNFLFALAPIAMGVVATIGALTALLAATIAVTQYDIKKVLAYSTVSQLGYMFLGVGVGAFTAGFFHVITHAFFKALLFLGSGSIIHALHHQQDMRYMGGLKKYMPITYATFGLAYLAIIGVPGFSGFFSKDEILWLTYTANNVGGIPYLGTFLYIVGLVTAGLTAFYMTRLMIMTFFGEYRGGGHAHDDHGHHGDHGHDEPHESPSIITTPLIVLAVLSVFGGLMNLPPVLTGHHGWLHHFLEPVFADAQPYISFYDFGGDHHLMHDTELKMIAGAITVVALGVFGAWYLYYREPTWRDEMKELAEGMFYRISQNKWYVDELYEATLIKPIVFASRNFLYAVMDVHIIDGAVNGVAAGARRLGSMYGRAVQTGLVHNYAFVIALGSAVFVLVFALGA